MISIGWHLDADQVEALADLAEWFSLPVQEKNPPPGPGVDLLTEARRRAGRI